MLGEFVWKYSDDRGATWSDRHYTIPVPYNYIETINSFSKVKNGTGNVQILGFFTVLTVLPIGKGRTLGQREVASPFEGYFVFVSFSF